MNFMSTADLLEKLVAEAACYENGEVSIHTRTIMGQRAIFVDFVFEEVTRPKRGAIDVTRRGYSAGGTSLAEAVDALVVRLTEAGVL